MKKKLIAALFETVPLFAGLLVVTAKPAPVKFETYLGRYVCFILLFTAWMVFRNAAQRIFSKEPSGALSLPMKIMMLAAASSVFITAIFLFHRRFERISYELSLALIAIDAFARRFKDLGRFEIFWTLSAVYYAGLGFMSFQMVIFSFEWQALLFSLAASAAPLMCAVAACMEGAAESDVHRLEKMLRLSMLTAPVSIGLLVMNGDLPAAYLSSVLLIPAISLFRKVRPEKIFGLAAFLSLLFIVNLAVLGIFG